MNPEPPSVLDVGRLELKLADLQRRLDEKEQEHEKEGLRSQGLEERVRALGEEVRTLEERAGQFQREAVSGAAFIAEIEETLRAAGQARAKLAEALERHRTELNRWRLEAEQQKSRADDLDQKLFRSQAALAEIEKTKAERERLAAEAKKAMENAEAVRREGIEALEQARQLKKKSTS